MLFILECTGPLIYIVQHDILCCRNSIKDVKHTLAQLHKILYHVSLSYDAFHVRAKEATLALALRLVHLLHHEIREGTLNITGMTVNIIIKESVGYTRLTVTSYIFFLYYGVGGGRLHSWLRHCATSWKVAGSIPDGVIGIFL